MRALIRHPDAPAALFFFAITFTLIAHAGR